MTNALSAAGLWTMMMMMMMQTCIAASSSLLELVSRGLRIYDDVFYCLFAVSVLVWEHYNM